MGLYLSAFHVKLSITNFSLSALSQTMLRPKKEDLHVKILASCKKLSIQLSMVLSSITKKKLTRMILLESSTRTKLSLLGISKFKYLLIAYHVLRGAQR